MNRFILGCVVGAGLVALFAPIILTNIIDERLMISDNGHIERNKKIMDQLTKKTAKK